ncbi:MULTISPECIES: isoprenyl transferase [unclassified Rothia (in: high G+C Gram-positive bacteria)]|uniref:isoprenyl transferase n=1 Tax=unclassified Rothia (in: high G+C Gram-positive bacteria) TaxID=2689056 RepID=UPI00195A507B|nr:MULTISPECIES: isoprenyl transferase [unclassified Rothia (in: high G+C Gram-positive bacteria)]MBM7051441.1 isoprenyl transferase [Rothia sp. ZJ1223]QRZ61233.1 isoprenyl transferase [Rothia sp. ZJ932]
MKIPQPVYKVYDRALSSSIPEDRLPAHIGVLVDGNRRWAAQLGQSTKHGHLAGASRITEFLNWCTELKIPMVTLYMLSTENLKRSEAELVDLLDVIEGFIQELESARIARIRGVGKLEALPPSLRGTLQTAMEATADIEQLHVNIAVGYGGRQEIVDAVRDLILSAVAEGKDLEELARSLEIDDISAHLYTKGLPDPDLLIRTSGEQRLSGFLTWQSAYSEFHFCEALWPDFRRTDFLRALRDYANRQRRFGS